MMTTEIRIIEFEKCPDYSALVEILSSKEVVDYMSNRAKSGRKGHEPKVSRLLRRSLELGSLAMGLVSLQNELENSSPATNPAYALKDLFSEDVLGREVTPSGASFLIALINPLVGQDTNLILPEHLSELLTPELRERLSALLENAINLMGQPKPPPIIAINTDDIKDACLYSYTFPMLLNIAQSKDVRLPIKVGCTDVVGLKRVQNQCNASTLESPLVLMACNIPEGIKAKVVERLFHSEFKKRGYVKTAGGGREWFILSVNELFIVAEELGYEPIVVTPPENW